MGRKKKKRSVQARGLPLKGEVKQRRDLDYLGTMRLGGLEGHEALGALRMSVAKDGLVQCCVHHSPQPAVFLPGLSLLAR